MKATESLGLNSRVEQPQTLLKKREHTPRVFESSSIITLNEHLLQSWYEAFLLKQEFGNCSEWPTKYLQKYSRI